MKSNYKDPSFRASQDHKFKSGNEHHNAILTSEEMALLIADRWNNHQESYGEIALIVNKKYNTTFNRKSLEHFIRRRIKLDFPHITFRSVDRKTMFANKLNVKHTFTPEQVETIKQLRANGSTYPEILKYVRDNLGKEVKDKSTIIRIISAN